MTNEKPRLELSDAGLEVNPTEAMRHGEQFVHQCAWCGTIVVWHRFEADSRLGRCPNCGADGGGRPADVSTWWQQTLPVAGLAPLGATARSDFINELISRLRATGRSEWEESHLERWLRAQADAMSNPHEEEDPDR